MLLISQMPWLGLRSFSKPTEECFQTIHLSLLPGSFYSSHRKRMQHQIGAYKYLAHSKDHFHIPENRSSVNVRKSHPQPATGCSPVRGMQGYPGSICKTCKLPTFGEPQSHSSPTSTSLFPQYGTL